VKFNGQPVGNSKNILREGEKDLKLGEFENLT
jgi:hypothetical protein